MRVSLYITDAAGQLTPIRGPDPVDDEVALLQLLSKPISLLTKCRAFSCIVASVVDALKVWIRRPFTGVLIINI